MKKILITISLILIAIISTVIAAPNFIDWNKYRKELTAQANSITGRNIQIRGDIKISILPSPVLAIKDVHVVNSPGATDAALISLKSLEVHLALAPLLNQSVQVKQLKLVDPVVNIEIMNDGKNNLFSKPKKTKGDSRQVDPETGATRQSKNNTKPVVRGFSLQIDNFVVENGVINYRHDPNLKLETVKDLNGRFRLASIKGPMDASGTASVQNIPIDFSLSVGQIVKERTLPFSFTTTIIPGEVKTSFNGTISNIKEDAKFKGKITTTGKNLRSFLSAVTRKPPLPHSFAKPFNAAANVTSDLETLQMKNFEIQLNDTKGIGSIEVALRSNIDANVLLSLNKIDLDSIFGVTSASLDIPQNKITAENLNSLNPVSESAQNLEHKIIPNFDLKYFPKVMNANLNLSVQSLIYKNSYIREAKLNASLVNREITLSQASALLPGNTDLAVFGFISEKPAGTVFDGTVDLVTPNLQELLRWNGLKLPKVPRDRLKTLKFSSKIKTDKKSIKLTNLKLQLDGTKIQGTSKFAIKKRPSLFLALTIGNINLDSYVSKNEPKKKSKIYDEEKRKSGLPINKQTTLKPESLSTTSIIATGNLLNSLDARLKATINSITASGIKASNVRLDSSISKGHLFINNGSFQNIAGLQGEVSGQLIEPNLTVGLPSLSFKDLKLDLRSKSFSPLLKAMGVELPALSSSSGPVRVNAVLNGRPDRLSVLTSLTLQKGKINVKGLALPLENNPSISGNIQITHEDLTSLLRSFDVTYRPTLKKMKEVKLSGKLKVSGRSILFKELTGRLAGIDVQGLVNIDVSGPRPAITANLDTSNINLNELIPQNSFSQIFWRNNPKLVFKYNPARSLFRRISWSKFLPPQAEHIDNLYVSKNNSGRWSRSPLDLTLLNSFDADVELATPSVNFNKLKLKQLKLKANLQKGKLNIHKATGKIFSGKLVLNGFLKAKSKSNQIKTHFSLDGLNLPLALRSFQDRTLNSGTMDFSGNLRTNGRNVEDLVSRLNGVGSMSFKDMGISTGAKHSSAFAGITSLLASLNQFATIVGGRRIPKKATLQGHFQVVNGIAGFNNTTLTSGIGNGVARGYINLRKWEVNSTGSLNLSKNVLMQMLIKKDAPKSIPFKISGLLDQPNVKLDTSGLSRQGIRIPGNLGNKLDSILRNKGIGSVLREIFPIPKTNSNSKPQSSKNISKPEAGNQRKPRQTLRPEDILKGVIRGLSK